MERLIITGGIPLKGEVQISGAKNAALPIMAASLLSEGETILHHVPRIEDVVVMKEILEELGAIVIWTGDAMIINNRDIKFNEVPANLAKQLRASSLLIGSLINRFRRVKLPFPGGCAIGIRPMDLHLKGLEALGTKVIEKGDHLELEAEKLKGAKICLDFPSVGATENLMIAATLAEGETVIKNPAQEPEVVDLQNYLNGLGAKITGAGGKEIKIQGVKKLGSGEHYLIPDRIEAGTYMVAAAITKGDVVLKNIILEHLDPISEKLMKMGVVITKPSKDSLRVRAPFPLKGVNCKTLPYPGFPTDMQPQLLSLMSLAEGTSFMIESIFDNRFGYVNELKKMGANVKTEGRIAIVKGVSKFTGNLVKATDLRGGAALFLAGLATEDITIIEKIGHIERGYAQFIEKASALGGRLMKLNDKIYQCS